MTKMRKQTCSRISDILNFIDKQSSGLHRELLFRGQANDDWKLIPQIDRVTEEVWRIIGFEVIEKNLITKFKKYSRPWLGSTDFDEIEWHILAQHHGVPTRLLDFTFNPLAALFFAVEDLSIAVDGCLWLYSPGSTADGNFKTIFDLNDLFAYFPKHIDKWIAAQKACFVSFPLPKYGKPFWHLEYLIANQKQLFSGASSITVHRLYKIVIPASCKKQLKQDLYKLGISYDTLFPGIDGVARSVKYISFDSLNGN